MNTANYASVYKNQQIMTASPEDLTLMLYNGAVRFVTESINALQQGDLTQSHNANLKAQNIVREFMCMLDMQYELSKNYMLLYDFICRLLIEGNVKKDAQQLAHAKKLLAELRDTWMQAMQQVKQNRGGQAVYG